MKYFVFLILFCPLFLFAQWDSELNDQNLFDYEKYNKFTNGKSVRMCDKKPCNGIQKDFWENGILKHKALYKKGKIVEGYENYYDNSHLERKFTVYPDNNAEMVSYFDDGIMKSNEEYFNRKLIKKVTFYPNGKVECIEEFDKDKQYLLKQNFYFMDGSPQTTMEIVVIKDLIYITKSYSNSGLIKEEGLKKFDEKTNKFLKNGIWKLYNSNGFLLKEVEYENDEIISPLD